MAKIVNKTSQPMRTRKRPINNIAPRVVSITNTEGNLGTVVKTGRDYSNVVQAPIINRLRFLSVDYLRAFVIILMIFTHVVGIFLNHSQSGKVAEYIALLGGTICFTVFLLLSGSSQYFTIFKHHREIDEVKVEHRRQKVIVRGAQIFLIYYILSFISVYVFKLGFLNDPSYEWSREAFRILFFQKIPPFTEFLIPLAAYILFSGVNYKFFYKALQNRALMMTISVAVLILGILLYQVDLGDRRLNLLKAVFAGHADIHTFPLFQYFIVFIVGIYVGEIYIRCEIFKRIKTLATLTIIALSIYILSSIIFLNSKELYFLNPSVYTGRFPPSIAFLSLTVALALIFLIGFELLTYKVYFGLVNLQTKLNKFVSGISSSALSFFVIHLSILFAAKGILEKRYDDLSYQRTDSISITIVFIAVLLLCLILEIIWKNFNLYFLSQIPLQIKINTINIVLLLLGVFAIIFGVLRNIEFNVANKISISQNLKRNFSTQIKDIWWDYEYDQVFKIDAEGDKVINQGNWVSFSINHKSILDTGVSKFADGRDLRVVEKNNNTFKELAYVIEGASTEDTKIKFKITEDPDSEYFLYVGNSFAPDPLKVEDTNGVETSEEVFSSTTLDQDLDIKIPKRWYLKGYKSPPSYEITINPGRPLVKENIIKANFQLKGADITGVLNYDPETNLFFASIDLNDIEPGTYYLDASVVLLEDSLKVLVSDTERIFVSYPIFVNWSIDWEGFGVNEVDLNDISDIASKYKIKLTHYFNPRIYVKDQFSVWSVSPGLASYYTSWVLNRKNNLGEEIGLHIHIYPDLLKEVGVKKNEAAQLVGIGRDETFIQGYSVEDLSKIFEWSLNKFYENGLPRPKSFRSGAWMSGPNVQEALVKWDFNLDSTGRTGGLLNPAASGSTPIPWNLSVTTKPYRPNIYDLNSSASPNFDIWQFPNNGADSYWFTKEELISRFNQNYKTIMSSPQVVTYLSHPHSFKQFDSDKVRGLFDYISKFDSEKDSGAVVITTLENIYETFDMNLFL